MEVKFKVPPRSMSSKSSNNSRSFAVDYDGALMTCNNRRSIDSEYGCLVDMPEVPVSLLPMQV